MGSEAQETEAEFIRAYTGAMLMAEAMVELRNIRRLLTSKEK